MFQHLWDVLLPADRHNVHAFRHGTELLYGAGSDLDTDLGNGFFIVTCSRNFLNEVIRYIHTRDAVVHVLRHLHRFDGDNPCENGFG